MQDHSPALPSTPPQKQPSGDDNLWIVFSHISPLLGVGLIVPLITAIAAMVFSIIAAVKSSSPIPCRYPLTLRLIK